jgi:hypothetical protein
MTQKRRTINVTPKRSASDVRVVSLSSYTTPKITESKQMEWVAYGDDNNYFQYLIDRYNGSPTNNAIINGISEMIYGKGLDATDSSRKPEAYAQMMSLFSNDCVRKLAYDLKLMGQCTMQIIYSKDRKKIAQVEHFPVQTLRAEKMNDKGEIEGYYYMPNWDDYKQSDKPKRFPAFGTSNEAIEILYVKPYRAGFEYYSPVDYQGGLQYAKLEEEISNYHINNIMNGLAPSMLINFNNGVPNEEERMLIEQRIKQKYQGSSNAGRFILSFNDDPASAATIQDVQLSDAHNQYQFLSDESMRKIMVAHRVVSPMLLGIKDQSGLGNNADELKTASILMDNTVIRPFQTLLLDAFDMVLAHNNISLNLYFKTLQPLEFTDLENAQDSETVEQETGIKQNLSQQCSLSDNKFDDLIAEDLIKMGEDEEELLKDYELIDEMEVDYDMEERLDKMLSLASTGTARPNAKSELDGTAKDGQKYLVRYQYAPLAVSKNSRIFCLKMVGAGKIYRKEDIMAMNEKAVNAGWGPKGADTYDIWLFKGGGSCHHFWLRKTYMYKDNVKPDVNSPLTSPAYKKEREAKGVKSPSKTEEPTKVSQKPKDMPNEGFLPTNKRFS